MTIFGKILAIFVFLLSLVWFFLTVNLYVTRADWKKAYTKANEAAEKNVKDADELKKQVQLERANIAAREQAAQQTVQAVAKQRDTIQAANDQLKLEANQRADAVAGRIPEVKEYDARIEKLQKQVDALTKENADVTKERDAYAKAAQDASNLATNATLQAKVSKDAIQYLTERLSRVMEARPGVAAAGGGGSFRGEVQKVSGDIISFSGGLNAGVKRNDVYSVTRDKAPYFVGTVTVTVADTQTSAGTFVPAKPGTDYQPKPGDLVESPSR